MPGALNGNITLHFETNSPVFNSFFNNCTFAINKIEFKQHSLQAR
jgi:hypothetical protein